MQLIGFLIIRGIHSCAMTSRKTHLDEIERIREHGGQQIVAVFFPK